MGVQFRQVVIVGVGLIGGSLGLVLKQKGLAGSVVGVGRRIENLEKAVELHAIDRYETDVRNAIHDADLVVLATPVQTYASHLRDWGQTLQSGAIVSDVGSVKGGLVEEAEKLLPAAVHFVGAHPIAGREKSGVAYASPNLFDGARCLVTPTKQTDPQALEAICQLWEAAGSIVLSMDPFVHDWVLGSVSHLPHVAAFGLMHALDDLQAQMEAPVDLLDFSGGGLRDTTRIAASSPEMWRDISLANRQNLVRMIETYIQHLEKFKDLLEKEDEVGLVEVMTKAKELRERLK
ncbi:MAG: prephenate dehydrogenase/arogenate dehydrogenase family protein [Nitrospirota bacterium]|nr:MAG: prephenate dehydrogenase/arogenate dehydrogenase family protein [Nitrospirota bacterium]